MPEHDDLTDPATIVVAAWRQLEPLLCDDDGNAAWAKASMGEAVDGLAQALGPEPEPEVVVTLGPGEGAAGAAVGREARRAEKLAMARAMAESGE